jgi:hypothetical protein
MTGSINGLKKEREREVNGETMHIKCKERELLSKLLKR